MRLEDSRRLTGPNLFSLKPGAVGDVAIEPVAQAGLVDAWRRHMAALLETLGWTESTVFDRRHATGVSLGITAPMDCLYAATDVNEAAFDMARRELREESPARLDDVVSRLRRLIDEERNPRLPELQEEAERRRVPFLVDDDEVSFGFGKHAQVFSSRQPPRVSEVDWASAGREGDVPVALVTGTNGKSTTVRLAASIVAASGRTAGVTSTDYIRVGDEVIDTGDYSGPGGARQLLRHADTEVALLEVARGGMLRRGLGVTTADVAMVTNVAADHLGEYGINTVAELRDAKFIVRKGLAPGKPLILNADDKGVVAYADQLEDQRLIWFSEDQNNPVVLAHVEANGMAVVVSEGSIVRLDENGRHVSVAVSDIPITMGGAARHNVQNALAAAALCHVLGCGDEAIAQGLQRFSGGPDDNPGRGNLFEGKGIRAIVDFAHNEHGLTSMATAISRMSAQRRLVLLGQAGDRSDELIEGLTNAALVATPDQLVICRLPGYERGRDPAEVSALIERVALDAGIDADAIHHADSPVDGTRFALGWARPGDVLLILALTQRGPCTQIVQRALVGDDAGSDSGAGD